MEQLQDLDRWHRTRSGYVVFGLLELAIAYGFASLAINYGSYWQYALAIVFLVGGLRNLFKLIGNLIHGNKRKTSKA